MQCLWIVIALCITAADHSAVTIPEFSLIRTDVICTTCATPTSLTSLSHVIRDTCTTPARSSVTSPVGSPATSEEVETREATALRIISSSSSCRSSEIIMSTSLNKHVHENHVDTSE